MKFLVFSLIFVVLAVQSNSLTIAKRESLALLDDGNLHSMYNILVRPINVILKHFTFECFDGTIFCRGSPFLFVQLLVILLS